MFFRKLSILSITMLLISMSYSFSQPIKKVKFGKISMEEMTMQTYSLDTTAEAVLLYQNAEFLPNNFQFRQHQRIKILKTGSRIIAETLFLRKVRAPKGRMPGNARAGRRKLFLTDSATENTPPYIYCPYAFLSISGFDLSKMTVRVKWRSKSPPAARQLAGFENLIRSKTK